MPRRFDCIIIGAGCSGTLTAFHLGRLSGARMGAPALRCAIIDPGEPGPGLPYRTKHPLHVLNVPAGRMSAIASEPNHFVDWCKAQDNAGHAPTGGDFVPRGIFGGYLAALVAESASRLKLEHVRSRAVELVRSSGSVEVGCADGQTLTAKQVVLAWGHEPPRTPAGIDTSAREHAGFVNNPWSDALEPARLTRGVMLIGTGLTMVDCAMTIAERSPDCRMLAVSRRGLLPQPHRHHDAPPLKLPPPPIAYWPTSTRGIVRAVRAYVRSCQSRGWDWREAITALRPVTSQLWIGLPDAEKQRFLEKLVPYWDSHRHRAAPQVAARVDQLQVSGGLDVLAARIVRVSATGDDLAVTLRPRGENTERTVMVGCVVNCTGPETDVIASSNPLVKKLLDAGMLARDERRLGLLTDTEGHPVNAAGVPLEDIWTLGPLRKAQLWETIAVPEIRVQAEELARKILMRIGTSVSADA